MSFRSSMDIQPVPAAKKVEAPSSPWTYFRKKVPSTNTDTKIEFTPLLEEVKQTLLEDKLMNEARLDQEVNWYFRNLGIHDYYFETNSAEEIAQDVSALYSAKCLSHFTGGDLEIKLQSARRGRHVFVGRSVPGHRQSPCIAIENMIEEKYLGNAPTKGTATYAAIVPSPSTVVNKRYRVQTYRTGGPVAPDSDVHLRFYFLSEPTYSSGSTDEKEADLDKVADKDFLKNITPEKKKFYQEIMNSVVGTRNPAIKVTQQPNKEWLLTVAYQYQQTHNYLSGITDLYHSYGLYSPRKFVDQFSNGITVFSIYLSTLTKEFTEERQHQIIADANLIFILPRTALTPLFRDGKLNAQEYAYTYAVWKFAYHFLARQAAEFNDLAFALKGNPVAANLLEQIKRVVRKEAYTEGRIAETLFVYSAVIKEMYRDFARIHGATSHLARVDSNLNPNNISTADEVFAKIQKIVPGELDRQVFKAFLTFNKHVLKTNFYKTTKVALSFRFDASFLSKEEFPTTPYGLFFIVGPEFRGFHIRMRDIARGGIRLIKSHNLETYVQNVSTVFQENYNLASTQDRKNKDIPEGGSKGTVLLSVEHQDKGFEAFTKYIDALIDLLLPEQEGMVDLFGKQEILFLGPDENTATYMDWASQHAKQRGYKFWKAFTTGKDPAYGGIPHDTYGMTTRSIHQYVLGTLKKLGYDEENCTKFQTGGPDGDLGSNEIKLSKDKTIGIVDGSGVLYDPQGLDRTALLAVADARKMAREFDKSKISAQGFFVDINDIDKKLPDGTVVSSGMDYRNNFHLNPLAAADFFVPCGGRPEAVNMSNVHKLMDETTKKPRYKFIVEGANLFFSQEARLILEKSGVVIFKDASANKGGVTSSSLEVLAALSFNDDEFATHMTGDADFYKRYVQDVQDFIEANARLEFNCIWAENVKSGTSRCLLTDIVSNKINELSYSISDSELWNNQALRRKVLGLAFPKQLQQQVGFDNMLNRVPENYLRAMFGTYLASHYVYETGLSATPEFSFFNFINYYMQN